MRLATLAALALVLASCDAGREVPGDPVFNGDLPAGVAEFTLTVEALDGTASEVAVVTETQVEGEAPVEERLDVSALPFTETVRVPTDGLVGRAVRVTGRTLGARIVTRYELRLAASPTHDQEIDETYLDRNGEPRAFSHGHEFAASFWAAAR